MRYEEDYKLLLSLIVEMCESVNGKTAPAEFGWLTDTQPFAVKLVQHLGSVLYLSHGTSVNGVGGHDIAYTDHASVKVLIRACFETYLTFHQVFVAAQTWEERKFRHKVWRLGGLITRQGLPVLTDEGRSKLCAELISKESLETEIVASTFYIAGNQGYKKQAKLGNWKLGKHWVDLAVEASFHKRYFEGVYGYLCDYAHSGSLSLLQINATDTSSSQREHAEDMHGICLIIMAHFVFAYPKIYKEAQIELDNSPELKHLAEIYCLKDEDMVSLYG